MNPENWISGTGLSPIAAMPTAAPTIPDSLQGGVDDAVAAELVEQALGRAEDAAVLPHILAQHEDVVVLAHLGVQSVSNRLYHGKVLCLAHSLLQECFVAVCLAERRELLVLPL